MPAICLHLPSCLTLTHTHTPYTIHHTTRNTQYFLPLSLSLSLSRLCRQTPYPKKINTHFITQNRSLGGLDEKRVERRTGARSVQASSCLCMRLLAPPLVFSQFRGPDPRVRTLRPSHPDPAVVEQLYLIATSPATNS